jgi:O-antigen ligase
MEAGFLFALFFTPWAPVPRYLGWFVALIAWATGERKACRSVLPTWMTRILLLFLGWSFVVSALGAPDLSAFIHGFSNPLEIAFAIWLAAAVVTRPGAQVRTLAVFWITTVLAAAWCLLDYGWAALGSREFSPLGNANTMGHCGLLFLGIWFATFMTQPPKGQGNETVRQAALVGAVAGGAIAFLSFSSLAWLSAAPALLAAGLLRHRPALFTRRVLRLGLGLAILAAAIIVCPGEPIAETYLFREAHQLSAVHHADTFTNRRSVLWEQTLPMIAERPLTGWGWGRYEDVRPVFWAERGVYVDPINSPHNLFLETAFDGGLPLTAIVIALILFTAAAAWRHRKSSAGRAVAYAFLAVFAAECLYSLAGNVIGYRASNGPIVWMLMGWVAILDLTYDKPQYPDQGRMSRKNQALQDSRL